MQIIMIEGLQYFMDMFENLIPILVLGSEG